MINQIQGGDYYEQKAKDEALNALTEGCHALFKRVTFYKTKGKEQNYIVPNDIKKLIEYDSDEALQERVNKIQRDRYEQKLRDIEVRTKYIKGKSVPGFLLDPAYFKIGGGRAQGRSMQGRD